MKKLLIAILLLIQGLLCAQTFGQNKVNATAQDWSVLKTMHFDIYFPRGEDEFGKTAALMAEDIYYYLKNDLKYPVLSRIPIIFYATRTEFQVTNIIYPLLSEGVGGFTESLRNRVVVPFDGSYSNLEELLAHELTHAYINALDDRVTNAIQALRPTAFPFWFSEGLPEFLSIGGEDEYNNMFILDMVVNDKLPKIEYIGGYLAYRLGESFLTYIADTYGREKVSEFFYSLRTMQSLEEATKRVFGIKFEDLESRWRYQLKRDYFPAINTHKIPQEVYERRTDHKKDGSYFNFSPRFSPDGSRYAYFSNAGARYSIWMGSTHGIAKAKKIITGEASGKMEEFYYMRSNLSWFPDGKRIAFSAKTAEGDRIHILDVDKKKIVRTLDIPQLRSIFEVDVSPDGQKIAISAQKDMQTDLYLYDLETKELQQLTDDSFYDAQPRFSPDGSRIAFSSQRDEIPGGQRYGFFANTSHDIFEYRLDENLIMQITKEPFDCTQPAYVDSGKKLAFVSARDEITNYEILDFEQQQIAPLTHVLAGTFNGDISQDSNYLLISNYFDGAWDIFFGNNPLKNLEYRPYPQATLYEQQYDLLDRVDFSALDRYGIVRKKPVPKGGGSVQNTRRPFFSGFEPTVPDTTLIATNFSWDSRPQESAEQPPAIRKYRPRFALDSLWGGFAYSNAYGAVGSIELGLSDLMGDHGIGISLGISDRLDESNIVLSYLYLKRRIDYGIGVYNLYNETYYRFYRPEGSDYWRVRQRQTGLYGLARYPFSRFSRLEFDNMLYQYEVHQDYLPRENYDAEEWIKDVYESKDIAYAPGLSLVFDNSLYGSTGPLLGFRGIYTLRKSFAKKDLDYLTNYVDLRKYFLFSRRYSIALRANAAISTGSSPDRFALGGYHGVRGLSQNLAGNRKVLTSAELRFPLLDYMSIAFPLPLVLSNIRGSAYVDMGAVWDNDEKFRGSVNGRLEDVKLSYGFGPRFNLGYFVLKLDVSWLTDLSKISKPQIYLSLSEDFLSTIIKGVTMKIDVSRKLPEHLETLVLLQEENAEIKSTEVLSEELAETINDFCALEEFSFKDGAIKSFTRLVHKKRQLIILCGVGEHKKKESYKLRNHIANSLREATRCKARTVFLMFDFDTGIPEVQLGHLLAESALLTAYKFNKYRSSDPVHEIENLHLIYSAKTNRHLNRGILEGRIFADAVILARDLVNEPANVINPEALAEHAKKAALQYGFSIDIYSMDKIRRLKMEAFLAVGKGSASEPKLIIMRYNGNPDKKSKLTALVGKGLTFDTGGYSIKPTNGMLSMKSDMGGAAAVIGAFSAIATLKLKVNVIGVIAAAENMISSAAYRPGDILTSMSGKTIEVVNTDAEGRLTLVDAVHYAIDKEKADRVLDIATLTGAAVAALGKDYSAVLGNDDAWLTKLSDASNLCGEKLWKMPLHEPYMDLIKSDVADLKNSGGPLAGCITAALFIREFVQDKPWIHIDIAGSSMRDKVNGIDSLGATGVGVRLLVNLLRSME